jgi:hypothetical protein
MGFAAKLVIGSIALMCGDVACALGWTDCKNDDKQIIRTEKEMWGANPVTWTKEGKTLKDVREFFFKDTKRRISLDRIDDGSYGRGHKEIYTIEVLLKEMQNEKIIENCEVTCQSFQFPHAID